MPKLFFPDSAELDGGDDFEPLAAVDELDESADGPDAPPTLVRVELEVGALAAAGAGVLMLVMAVTCERGEVGPELDEDLQHERECVSAY